jgi:hypothetical protein
MGNERYGLTEHDLGVLDDSGHTRFPKAVAQDGFVASTTGVAADSYHTGGRRSDDPRRP